MLIYKYLDTIHNTLSNCVLKASIPSSLNDPFECLLYNQGRWTEESLINFVEERKDEFYVQLKECGTVNSKEEYELGLIHNRPFMIAEIRKHLSEVWFSELLTKMKLKFDEHMRIISFSSEHCSQFNETLLWSHYSSGHKGIRLTFCAEELIEGLGMRPGSLCKVEYSENRVGVDFTSEKPDSISATNKIRDSILTKSIAWEYESEYRLILQTGQWRKIRTSEGKEVDLLQFPPLSLKRVDIGLCCDERLRAEIDRGLENCKFGHVELYQARLHESDYALKYLKLK